MYASKYPGVLGYGDEIRICRLVFSFQVTTELAAFVLIISAIPTWFRVPVFSLAEHIYCISLC